MNDLSFCLIVFLDFISDFFKCCCVNLYLCGVNRVFKLFVGGWIGCIFFCVIFIIIWDIVVVKYFVCLLEFDIIVFK